MGAYYEPSEEGWELTPPPLPREGRHMTCFTDEALAARDAELARLRAVVEAAQEWRKVTRLVAELVDGGVSRPSQRLCAAVDAYESAAPDSEVA
jgi:hypothetical protein